MIKDGCEQHEWIKSNDHTPYGGGLIQSMYECVKCHNILPASEVFQLEALQNQNETLKHLKGFEKNIAIAAVVISFFALLISLYKK